MDSIIYEFQKNASERVIAKVSEFQGRQVFSLWVYWNDSINGTENWRPSKKGLSMQVSLIPELKKAVDLAYAEYLKFNPEETEADQLLTPA